MTIDPRARMRELAADAVGAGSPTVWFEQLYQEAADEMAAVPWVDLAPNPMLTAWLDRDGGATGRALVVGCGAGDDAAELARRGWRVTAFDIAPTAIAWSRRRFPDLPVAWAVADALALPDEWRDAFDLVVEIYTLQTLPGALRGPLLRSLAATLAPGGRLLAICRGREPVEPEGALPWKLTRDELEAPLAATLDLVQFDDLRDGEQPPQRRFRITWRRPRR